MLTFFIRYSKVLSKNINLFKSNTNYFKHYNSLVFYRSNRLQRSPLVNLINVDKSYGDRGVIIQDVNISLSMGDRMMLFGVNGGGKSTLGKIIAREIDCDLGTITYASNTSVGYFPQDIQEFISNRNIESVRDCFSRENINVIKKLGNSTSSYNGFKTRNKPDENDMEFDEFNIRRTLMEIGNKRITMDRNINSLSEGEQSRVILASVLWSNPDLLILDEPTNHLDNHAREWLEYYISDYSGALLIITHDRSLISTTGNIMAEIDPGTKTLQYFRGSYAKYLDKRKIILKRERQIQRIYQSKVDKLKLQIRKKEKRKGKSGHEKSVLLKLRRRYIDLRNENPNNPILDKNITFRFGHNKARTRPAGVAISFYNISKYFNNIKVLNNCTASLNFGDRIVIIGENGCGKTTLMKSILGKLQLDKGIVDISPVVNIGYLPQGQSELDAEQTISEEFQSAHNNLRSESALFHLFDYKMLGQAVDNISVGQKRRLQISKLIASEINVLLLDEPTNHLDLASSEALEEALMEFPGAILAISHDRYFINKIATEIWELKQGKLFVSKPKQDNTYRI